jgi:hypothetical protein
MLPPFIIEQIRKREEQERQQNRFEQPRIELPLDYYPVRRRDHQEDEDPHRGVIIVELG